MKIYIFALRNGYCLIPPHPLVFRNALSRKRCIPTHPLTVTYLLNHPLAFSTWFPLINLSCSSTIEVPYYSVDHFPVVCIYCGVTGTKRTLNESVENYPKCNSCGDKPDIVKRKRKSLVQKDLGSKKKK